MEPVVDQMKGFAKVTHDKAQGLLKWLQKSHPRSPIEILKRLQREAFSDIMKLRDRQEKVERLLTFKSSKSNPFRESSTRVKGKVDIVGALFFMDGVDDQNYDAIQRSEIKTGIEARLAFETVVREKDTILAEFVAREKGQGDITLGGRPLSLAKVLYRAHVNDWFSAFAIPMGARCGDVGISTSSHQGMGLSNYSEYGPPLLNEENGSALGIVLRKSNVAASLAQFVSGIGMQVNSAGISRRLSTFGQVVCRLPGNTKLSLLGVHRESRPSGQNVSLGSFALPVSVFKRDTSSPETSEEDNPASIGRRNLGGSIALMVDSELDESTSVGGWVETNSSDPGYFRWAFTMRDAPEDEFGWGLALGGSSRGPKSLERFQVETYLNLNFGGSFKLQPGFVYVRDGGRQFPALMLRSSWFL